MTDWPRDGAARRAENCSVTREDADEKSSVDIDDRLSKGLGSFLGQIVPDAARDDPVRISTREFPGIDTGVRVRCTIGIAFKGNGGHGDVRTCGEPLFQLVIVRLACSQSQSPAIIMDHDADMIRVVEGGIVEVPVWRSELPSEVWEQCNDVRIPNKYSEQTKLSDIWR
jgi:hypothetical protein